MRRAARGGTGLAALVAALSVTLAVILALDLIPFLRGAEVFHWQWPYEPVGAGRALALAACRVV